MKKFFNQRTAALIGLLMATLLLILAMIGVIPLALGAFICEIGIICFSVCDIISGKDRTRGFIWLTFGLCRVLARIAG